MKKIIFITGTRADFGKLKSLIDISIKSKIFKVYIFCTGMHLQKKYGQTVDEIKKNGYENIFEFINYSSETTMDQTLAKTVLGLSDFIKNTHPDLIVVHGDRLEALAGAIVGSFNNILVSHIEGGEVSGTIDDSIRHAVTKLSHIHFVSNEEAKNRVIQLGEKRESIKVIGSPDIDILKSKKLKTLKVVQKHYEIYFDKNYAVAIFHPVTTQIGDLRVQIKIFVDSLIESKENYIVILPNNDLGSSIIFEEYKRIKTHKKFKVFPSIRFEFFIVLLKNSKFIIGNSSSGIIEAPVFGVPTINLGSRQNNRTQNPKIIHLKVLNTKEILRKIKQALNLSLTAIDLFGKGNSDKNFLIEINEKKFWNINKQKEFQESNKNE